jgi:HK97 gp10 family phage protein
MSFRIAVNMDGVQELRDKLKRMAEESRGEILREAAEDGASEFLGAARANAPVLKRPDPRRVVGNLRDRIKLFVLKRQPGRVAVGVGLGRSDIRAKINGAFYALWVEYGTAKMDAMPFLRPAFDSRSSAASSRTIAKFREWVEGFAG